MNISYRAYLSPAEPVRLLLLTCFMLGFYAQALAKDDAQKSSTYDQLPPEEFEKAMPPREKIEDKLQRDIAEVQKDLDRVRKESSKTQAGLRRAERIEATPVKQLFDDFTNKKIPYKDYVLGATPAELKKTKESLRNMRKKQEEEIQSLAAKKKELEQELQDYRNIRRPADSQPVPTARASSDMRPVAARSGRPVPVDGEKEVIATYSGLITDLKKELAVEEDYLVKAQEWEKSYPGGESRQSVIEQQQRVDEIHVRLKQATETLTGLQGVPPSAVPFLSPAPGKTDSKKPLSKQELKEWQDKGFTKIEIETLYNGGIVVDETGHSITGWPPSSRKRKLSLWDRLKK